MNKAKVEFELDDRGRAVFEGNDVIRGGTLFVSVGSRDVASPVIFDFMRDGDDDKSKAFFAMSISEVKRMMTYLMAEGV